MFGEFLIGIIIGLFSLGCLSIILSIILEKNTNDYLPLYKKQEPKVKPLENFDDFLDD